MSKRYLRLKDVRERVPLSKSTLYAKMAAGEFPAAHSLTGARAVGWLEEEIDLWIDSRRGKPGLADHRTSSNQEPQAAPPVVIGEPMSDIASVRTGVRIDAQAGASRLGSFRGGRR